MISRRQLAHTNPAQKMMQRAASDVMQNVGLTAPLYLYKQNKCKREVSNLGVVPADIWEAMPPPSNPAAPIDIWHSLQGSFMATPIPVDTEMSDANGHHAQGWNAVHDFYAKQLHDLSSAPCRAPLGPAVVRCDPHTLGALLQAENELLDDMCHRNGPRPHCQ